MLLITTYRSITGDLTDADIVTASKEGDKRFIATTITPELAAKQIENEDDEDVRFVTADDQYMLINIF